MWRLLVLIFAVLLGVNPAAHAETALRIDEEGTKQGFVWSLDFVGCSTASVAASRGTIDFSGCGGGSGDSILVGGTNVADASGVDLIGGTNGIDIAFVSAVSPDTATFNLDTTEVEATTWGAGGNASNVWTGNVSGTDTTLTWGSGMITLGHDLTITGDDLFMATNTSGAALIADGTNFNPVVISGDLAIGTTGTATIQANAVALGTDSTNNYVATIADAGNANITVANSGTESAAVTLDVVDVTCTNCLTATEVASADLATLASTVTVVDGTDATSFPAIFDSATGDLAIKTDAGLTYAADTGTLNATVLTEGGNAVFNGSEVPGGELGGTWASPTIDDSVTVTGWVLGTSSATTLTAGTVNIDLLDAVGAVDMDYGSADVTDHTFTTDGTGTAEIVLPAGSIDSTEVLDDTLVNADLNSAAAIAISKTALTAGRSLTLSTNDVLADAELYTDTKCLSVTNPTGADFQSVWFAKQAATLTSLWCESDQTVTAMVQVDDGSVADVDGTDMTCDATPPEDTSLNGDATLASGDRLDLDVASVASSPTWLRFCWTLTYDD